MSEFLSAVRRFSCSGQNVLSACCAASCAADTGPSGIVDFWLIRSDLPRHFVSRLEKVLDGAELGRASALTLACHRRRFIVAHAAARLIIGHRLGVPPEQIRWRHGEHGKPELAGEGGAVHVSLSHSGDLAMFAVTRGRRVGVDVQQFPAGIDAVGMAGRFYPAAEARWVAAGGPAGQVGRFVRLWARKEACVKVTGGRLAQGLKLPVGSASRMIVTDPGGVLPGPYLVQDVPAPRGSRAAVAVEGTHPCRASRHWWPGDLSPRSAGGPRNEDLPYACAGSPRPAG